MSGHFHDPVVGRDALFGASVGVLWTLIARISDLTDHPNQLPLTWTSPNLLLGFRDTLGAWLTRGPEHVREALLYFFLLFLLRLLLRNQWLGALAFTVIFTAAITLGSNTWGWDSVWNLLMYGLLAGVVLRFGLLALAVAIITNGFLGAPPSLQTSAWYFGNLALLTLSAIVVIVWAFYTSVGGRRAFSLAL